MYYGAADCRVGGRLSRLVKNLTRAAERTCKGFYGCHGFTAARSFEFL